MNPRAKPESIRSPSPESGLAGGTLVVAAAEALAFPAGLIVTILLTRHLPQQDYGALALALAGIAWLEWTVVSLFAKAAFKLASEAEDWKLAAAAIVRSHLLAGAAVGVVVFFTAGTVSELLGAPMLALPLRILALEIPIFVLAQGYRAVLVGRGMHGSRAAVAAMRWTVRAALVVAGVAAGLGLPGITTMIVAATAVELLFVWFRATGGMRLDIFTRGGAVPMRRLLGYAAPLAIAAICMRLFDRLDIFALRALGGSLESVAAYGVAQNLALAPAMFGGAFVPGLIGALSYRHSRGDGEGAARLAGDGIRAGILVLPFTLLTAGAAPPLMRALFGAEYDPAAPLFAILVVAATATLIVVIATGILAAVGQFRSTIVLTAPLLLIALAGHLLVVPRAGAVGAALVTAGTALVGAVAACMVVGVVLRPPFPLGTLGRALVIGSVSAGLAWFIPAPGLLILPLLLILTLAIIGAMILTGELKPEEKAMVRRWVR